MKPKLPPDSPYKEQLRRILWLVGEDGEALQHEQNTHFVVDVVYFVQKYVTTTNRTIMDLRRKVATLEAELEKHNGPKNTTSDNETR